MNHSSPIILIALILVLLAGCGAEKIESTWASNPIVVDGYTEEWPASQLTYVEKVRGVFGAANDDSSLSVMFRFRDQRIAQKAMLGGATLWWGRDGEKDKDLGIRYAGKFDSKQTLAELPDPENMMMRGGGGRVRFREPEEGQLHDQIMVVELGVETPLESYGEKRLAAMSTYHNGFYTYEVTIPRGWTELYPNTSNAGPGEEIRMCVELGGMDPKDREILEDAMKDQMRGSGGMGPQGGGMGGRGGRGGPGGGMGGPGGGRGREGMKDMFDKEEMWFTIRLAEGPAEGDSTS